MHYRLGNIQRIAGWRNKMFRKLVYILKELLSSKPTLQYYCTNCNGLTSRTTEQCPHCGIWLSGIRCLSCGYRGPEDDFIDDICPNCGDLMKQPSGWLGFIFNLFKRDSRSKIEKQKDRELERLFGIYAQVPREQRGKKPKMRKWDITRFSSVIHLICSNPWELAP